MDEDPTMTTRSEPSAVDRGAENFTHLVGAPILLEPFMLAEHLGTGTLGWILVEALTQEILE